MDNKFGGKGGNINYEDMPEKKNSGSPAGSGLEGRGGSSKTEGIMTTDNDDAPEGTVKDTKFRSVADASGWGR